MPSPVLPYLPPVVWLLWRPSSESWDTAVAGSTWTLTIGIPQEWIDWGLLGKLRYDKICQFRDRYPISRHLWGLKILGISSFFSHQFWDKWWQVRREKNLTYGDFLKMGGPYETSLILDIMGVCPFWELCIYIYIYILYIYIYTYIIFVYVYIYIYILYWDVKKLAYYGWSLL